MVSVDIGGMMLMVKHGCGDLYWHLHTNYIPSQFSERQVSGELYEVANGYLVAVYLYIVN